MHFRLEIDGTRGTYAFDMHNWPRDLNQSSYVSYDGAGETVQSQYPFSFDHIGQYRYEIRITSVYYSIAKVDPFSNNDTTLYEWISWHDPQEYHIRPEYDPARHLIFFQTQRWAPLWELRMLDLANTNSSRLMRSDLVSPALALLYSAQNAKDGPSVVFLTKSGLWSLTTLNGTWTEELLVDNKTLNAGDLSAIKNLAVDHSYVYYTNGLDGLHVYSRGDMKTRIIKVALTPADPVGVSLAIIDKESNQGFSGSRRQNKHRQHSIPNDPTGAQSASLQYRKSSVPLRRAHRLLLPTPCRLWLENDQRGHCSSDHHPAAEHVEGVRPSSKSASLSVPSGSDRSERFKPVRNALQDLLSGHQERNGAVGRP